MLRWGIVPVLALAVMTGMAGCHSQQQKALEQATQQAAATGQAQQVVSVDKDGNTTTTVVQPAAQGQTQPTVTTTTASPAAGKPKPSPKGPTVSPMPQQDAAQQFADQLAQEPVQQLPGEARPGGQQLATAKQLATARQLADAGQPATVRHLGQGGQPGQAGQASGAGQPGAEVRVPAGTPVVVRVDQTIGVKTAHAGDQFTGEVVDSISDGYGNLLIQTGARVAGVVDAAHKGGIFRGASLLQLRLTSMQVNGKQYPLQTRDVAESKKGKGKRTVAMVGGESGLGMLIGGATGDGKGVLLGGLAGAGAGSTTAGLTGNKDLVIPAESVLQFELAQDVVVEQRQ